MPLDVLCVGVATLDTIATVDAVPGEDERVVSDPFVVAGGGPAATAAVALARLGVSVGFCGTVGDDAAGALVREGLEREGVDTGRLTTVHGLTTTQSVILVSRASRARTIVTTPSRAPRVENVPTDAASWLHVDQTGYAAVRAALADRPASTRLSVDGGNPIPGLELDGVALYAPTVSSLTSLFPADELADSLRAAARAGAGSVVATAGGDGSYLLVDDEVVRIEPFQVDAVSTMGAGDVFHGAILAGLVGGRDLSGATRWANAVAALSCRALDGRSGIPDATATEEFLAAVHTLPLLHERSSEGEK